MKSFLAYFFWNFVHKYNGQEVTEKCNYNYNKYWTSTIYSRSAATKLDTRAFQE